MKINWERKLSTLYRSAKDNLSLASAINSIYFMIFKLKGHGNQH